MISFVDIVIVNWNSGLFLKNCIESIKKFHSTSEVRIYIYDNASSDGSLDFAMADPDVHIIYGSTNAGFGAACNRAAECGSSKYILFLNPDTEVFSDSIRKPCEFLENDVDADYGVASVMMIDQQGRINQNVEKIRSVAMLIAQSFGVEKLLAMMRSTSAIDPYKSDNVEHVIGAFYLIRRDLFERLGGFDERFFVYFEDMDLSYRVSKLGISKRYLADVTAFHRENGTSDQIRAMRLFYFSRSKILFSFKHFNVVLASCILLATLFVEPFLRMAKALILRSRRQFEEVVTGFALLWKDLPNIFRNIRKHRSS